MFAGTSKARFSCRDGGDGSTAYLGGTLSAVSFMINAGVRQRKTTKPTILPAAVLRLWKRY